MSRRPSESLNQYNIHRALSTIVRTTLLVVVAGTILSLASEQRYQCTVKVMIDGGTERQPIADSSNPLSGLFGASGFSMANQIEIMKGDKVISDTCKDADIPEGSVSLNVHQVPGTSVFEIVVDGNVPTYVERFAKTYPNSYMGYVTGNRRVEIANAFSFAVAHLKEENDKLVEAEVKQEQAIVRDAAFASTRPYARKMREMQREIDLHQKTVDLLINSIEDLRLRGKMTHDPVLVLSPAKTAHQISPTKMQYVLDSAAVGLVLGLFAAGIQLLFGRPQRA